MEYFTRLSEKNKLTVLFAFSFLLRIVAILTIGKLKNPQMWEFGTIAMNMYSGLGYYFNIFNDTVHPMLPSAHMPPGEAYLIFFIFKLFGPFTIMSNFSILLINAVFAGISVIIIYKISKIIYGENNAVLSALLISVFPVYIFSTVNYNSIIIYHLLLGMLFLFFLLSFYKQSNTNDGQKYEFFCNNYNKKYLFLFAVTMGLFYYFRCEFPLLMVFIGIFLIWKKLYKPAVIITVISILIIVPWTIRNYYTFERVVLITTSLGLNLHKGHNSFLDGSGWHNGTNEFPIYVTEELGNKIKYIPMDSKFEIRTGDIAFNDAVSYIKLNPWEENVKSLRKIFYLWIYDKNHSKSANLLYLIPWVIILFFFLIGYISSLKNQRERKCLIFLSIYLIFLTLTTVVFFSIPRYQIQASYIMIPVSVNGIFVFYSIIKKKIYKKS